MKTIIFTTATLGFGLAAVTSAWALPDGEALFKGRCSACHQVTGKGIPGAFPALAGDPFVLTVKDDAIVKTVLQGRGGMPSFAASTDDDTIAAILTYVRSAWGNKAPKVKTETVAAIRKEIKAASGNPVHN